MKTLKELIEARKCRKGKSNATTEHGAFWLATEAILIRSFGGDGVGQSRKDLRNYLQLQHYRSGEIKAVIQFHGWHENDGESNSYRIVPILDCATIEDVIMILKGISEDENAAYSDWWQDKLTDALTRLGMIEAAPGPDDAKA